MPAPQASMLNNLAKLNFKSKGIKLPLNWSQPSGDAGKQYNDSFKPNEKMAVPNPAKVFAPASTNKYHVDTHKQISEKFEKYIKGITTAICGGINKWMKATMFTVGIVNAVSCTITPGSCQGPPLMGMIMASNPPMATPNEMKYTNAIVNALNTAWTTWSMGLAGTIMYPPNMSVVPAPIAPPSPNIPLPLASLSSPGESMLSPSTLGNAMAGLLGDPQALHHKELFDAIAKAFNTAFTTFKASTMITGVKGTGPNPTFAPPYVPVGPVVAGFLIPTPPNLS